MNGKSTLSCISAVWLFILSLIMLDGCGGKEETLEAPSNLTAELLITLVDDGRIRHQIDLQWTDNSDNDDYFAIERKTEDGFFSEIGTVGADETCYQDNEFSYGFNYSYRVRAFNYHLGYSDYSNEADGDSAPPETTITASPPDPSVASNASFEFSSSEDGSTFECMLDSGDRQSCTSPKEFQDLSHGSHVFQVKAIDQSGNIEDPPASFTWTVDLDTWTWQAISTDDPNLPSKRNDHTAIWAGTEMIVWGGWGMNDSPSHLNTGGIYNPSDNTWMATDITSPDTPTGRRHHTAIWTGSEMIIWGGYFVDFQGHTNYLGTGSRYNPLENTWTAVNSTDRDRTSARSHHTAIWTGSEMIVWGGKDVNNTGGIYTPSTDSWRPTSSINAPSARYGHTAIWTGSEMIVWGGKKFNTGGIYDPSNDTWRPFSTAGAPSARWDHSAVWTGTKMIVWGGYEDSGDFLNTGGIYDPSSDTWTSVNITDPDTPQARYHHSTVWTGSEMIIWGGLNCDFLFTGGRYNPLSDSWTATNIIDPDMPSARSEHTAVWTGTEMIVFGGRGTGGNFCGIYSP